MEPTMRMSESTSAQSGPGKPFRLIFVVAATVILMAGCSSSEGEASEAAPATSSSDIAEDGDGTADDPAGESASDGTGADGASDQTSWSGPDWIDFPPGYERTFSFPIDPERGEGAIYGTIPDPADLPAGLAQVLDSFEANGYTIRQVRDEYAEVFDATGSVVLLSTRQFDEPPTLNLVFLSPDEAASRGILASSATLEASIGSQTITATGGCTITETGNTFVGVDGIQSVGFSQRADGTQLVQVLLTAPDGVEYTTSGGDITAPDDSGFSISTGMIGSGGELVDAVLTIDCG